MMTVILVDVLIIAVLLTADLVSKHYAAKYLLSHGGCYEAIKNVLSFRYSENSGAAFGMFDNARVFLCVFVGIVILAVLVFMGYHIFKKKYKEKGGIFLHVTLSMIVAGGLGNLIDRIAFGYVRDFIEYTIVYTLFKKDFAICNLADVFLTVGVILLIGYLIYAMTQESKTETPASVSPTSAQEDASKEEDQGSKSDD